MSEFYVGQEVVCVDDGPPRKPFHFYHKEAFPTINAHYTIRNIDEDGGVQLCELVNPVARYRQGVREISFHPDRFASIKPESIQIFRDMCINIKRKTDA